MVRLDDDLQVEKVPFTYSTHFMGMSHNMVCAVCKENSGVQDCSDGVMQPCWDCQKRGYVLIKLSRFIIFLDKLGLVR